MEPRREIMVHKKGSFDTPWAAHAPYPDTPGPRRFLRSPGGFLQQYLGCSQTPPLPPPTQASFVFAGSSGSSPPPPGPPAPQAVFAWSPGVFRSGALDPRHHLPAGQLLPGLLHAGHRGALLGQIDKSTQRDRRWLRWPGE